MLIIEGTITAKYMIVKMTNPIHETIPNPIEIMLNLLAESEAFFARTISPAAYAEFT